MRFTVTGCVRRNSGRLDSLWRLKFCNCSKNAGIARGSKLGPRQGVHAETIGLFFEGTGEVEFALRDRGRGERDGGVAGGMAAGAEQHRRQHAGHRRQRGALRVGDHARDVPLGDMRDFVRHHRGKFSLALGGEQESGMHADETARDGEGVDAGVFDDIEMKLLPRAVATGHQPLPQSLEVIIEFRVVEKRQSAARLTHDVLAELSFLQRCDHRGGLIAQVRQVNIVSRRPVAGQQQRSCHE